MKSVLLFLDDIFFLLGLVSFVVASYLVNPALGTYTLGVAFFIAAIFSAMTFDKMKAAEIIKRFQKKKGK